MGTLVVAPFMLERSFGIIEVSRISAVLIARPLGFSLGAWCGGLMEKRLGGRAIMVSGSVILSAALAGTGVFAQSGWLAGVIVLLFATGVGLGTIRPAAVTGVANSVDDADLGAATGSMQMLGHIGGATGITIMITVLGPSDSPGRFLGVFLLAAAIAAMSAAAAWWSPGGSASKS